MMPGSGLARFLLALLGLGALARIAGGRLDEVEVRGRTMAP